VVAIPDFEGNTFAPYKASVQGAPMKRSALTCRQACSFAPTS